MQIEYDSNFPLLVKPSPHVFLQQQLCVMYFHLVRTHDINVVLKIGKHFEMLIEYIQLNMKEGNQQDFLFYLASFYKMIGQTRDIVNGKGERDLTYMMICVFYKYYPYLASVALRLIFEKDYGCWADFKYFCHFVLHHFPSCSNLISVSIDIAVYQLDKDRYNWDNALYKYFRDCYGEPKKSFERPDGRLHMSLVAKWIPRESSKYSWLYERIVSKWSLIHSPFLFENVKDCEHYTCIMRKCKMEFRRILSSMNRELDTAQIKQCENKWVDIYPEKVPMHCLLKQQGSYLGNTKPCKEDSSQNFKNYFYFGEPGSKFREKYKKTSHMDVGYFVKQARYLLKQVLTENVLCQMHFLDRAWRDNVYKQRKCVSKYGGKIRNENMLPIVDISFDLDMESQNNAIGMGILISQMSPLNRILFTEHSMTTLEVKDSLEKGFMDIIREIMDIMKNTMTFQLESAMKTLGEAKYLFGEPTYLIVLSSNSHLYEFLNIECSFCSLVFWNVGTYSLDYELIDFDIPSNILYLSGTSPILIHKLQQENFGNNQFQLISHLLNTDRYDAFSQCIYNAFYSQTIYTNQCY